MSTSLGNVHVTHEHAQERRGSFGRTPASACLYTSSTPFRRAVLALDAQTSTVACLICRKTERSTMIALYCEGCLLHVPFCAMDGDALRMPSITINSRDARDVKLCAIVARRIRYASSTAATISHNILTISLSCTIGNSISGCARAPKMPPRPHRLRRDHASVNTLRTSVFSFQRVRSICVIARYSAFYVANSCLTLAGQIQPRIKYHC